jgi:DNA-nicking Smr family endonuclease
MGKIRRILEVSGHLLSGSLLGQSAARTLDLHGKTTAEARRMVTDFILTTSRGASGQVVQIVTGKGTGPACKPVLLPLVRQWLETDLARYVDAVSLAFNSRLAVPRHAR